MATLAAAVHPLIGYVSWAEGHHAPVAGLIGLILFVAPLAPIIGIGLAIARVAFGTTLNEWYILLLPVSMFWSVMLPICWIATRRWAGWWRVTAFMASMSVAGIIIATLSAVKFGYQVP